MKMKNLKCENCGHKLLHDENSGLWKCPACDGEYLLQEEINNYINNYIIKVDPLMLSTDVKDYDIVAGTVIRYKGISSQVCIPSGVVAIAEGAFENQHGLEKVFIPHSVTEIHNRAFKNCTNLKEVSFGSRVEMIGDEAFFNCSRLKTVELPMWMKKLGKRAFMNCSSLTSLIICNNENGTTYSLMEIEEEAFSECSSLKEILLNNVKYIKEKAFYNCKRLKALKGIDDEMLRIRKIGEYAFCNCESLFEIEFANMNFLEEISPHAFENCFSIHSVEIAGFNTIIKEKSFLNCTSLERVHIKSGQTKILDCAFENCTKLEYYYEKEPCTVYVEGNTFKGTPILERYAKRWRKKLCLFCGAKTHKYLLVNEGSKSLCRMCDDCYKVQDYEMNHVLNSLGDEIAQYRMRHHLCRYCGGHFNTFFSENRYCIECRKPKDY